MKVLLSLLIMILCSCSRFADQKVELSSNENSMTAPPCKCKVRAQNLALQDDSVYNKL